MLRITSLNLNGIRSAYNKGLATWLKQHQADIVCLQELKAHLEDIHEDLQHPHDYTGHFYAAEKKATAVLESTLNRPLKRLPLAWAHLSSIAKVASFELTGQSYP